MALKFSEKIHNKNIPIEWRSKKIIDRPLFPAFNRKIGGKYIGSYGSLEKWPTICCILIFNVWLGLDER